MSAAKYDLVVIGSGPAGQRAAVAAAKMGKRVAVVEARAVVGGVCINTGTIPSKTMREAVLHLSGYNYRSVYGVNYRVKEKITMADLSFRVQHVIKTEIDVTVAQLSRNNVETLSGVGSFVDPHTAVGIAVAEKELRDPTVPMIVLSTAHAAKFPDAVEAACGARPALPEWLCDLDTRPERVTVLPAEQSAVERFVLATSRAAQEGAAA